MLKEEYLIGREDANRADILINNDTVCRGVLIVEVPY